MKEFKFDKVTAAWVKCHVCGAKLRAGLQDIGLGLVIEHVEPCKNCSKEGKQ